MIKNNIVLDRFFNHSTWVIKRFLTFVFIIAILGVVLYNSSDPVWTSTYLGDKTSSVTIDLNKSGQTQFLIFATNSAHENDQYTQFTIRLFLKNDGNWTFLQTFPSERVVHILSLDRGTYKLEFENQGNLNTNIEVIASQADPTFLILFFGSLVAFGIFLFFIQMVFPLYFILLVISLLKTPANTWDGVAKPTQRAVSSQKRKSSLMGISEEDLTQNDKIGFVVAATFFIIGLIGDAFPMIFFGALIFIGTYSNAQNRSKLRKRFINYVNHPPFPHTYTLKEIAFVLGEDVEKLESLVLRLILDLGYPMEYNKEVQTVKVLETLVKPGIEIQPKIRRPISVAEEESLDEEEEQPTETSSTDHFCVKCGVILPEGARFCYNCGSKT